MTIKINSYKFKIIISLLLYVVLFAILHFSYIIYGDSYNALADNTNSVFEFLPIRFICVFLLVLLNIIVVNLLRMNTFLYSILNLILIFFVIPGGLFYASNAIVPIDLFMYTNILLWFIYFFSLINWNFENPVLDKNQTTKVLLAITIVGLIPFLYVYYPYINLKNLLLIDVYKTRTLVTDNINNLYTGYTYSWYGKIILPIIMVFSLFYKNRFALLIGFVLLMFLYLCGSHKIVFLGTFTVLVFYKYDYLKKTYLLIKLLVLLTITTWGLDYFFNYDYGWTITMNRIFMLNPLLDFGFYDFFYDKPIYWSDSFMSRWVSYPYELTPSHTIGKEYLSKPHVNANTGIIANGFKNAGVLGAFINIIIVSIYISLLNFFKISPKFFGLFILLIFTFTNASLSGSVLTHGLLILFIMSMFVLRNTKHTLT